MGSDMRDVLGGAESDACIAGLAESDRLEGSLADDELIGGSGDDVIVGAAGDDVLHGGVGKDSLSGNLGADVLIGGRGDDRLLGGEGNDRLYPGMGRDEVRAGPGDDRIAIHDHCELAPGETIDGGAGHDVLVLSRPLEDLETLGVAPTLVDIEVIAVDRMSMCRAECTLPCPDALRDEAVLAEPVRWFVDPSGVRFRRTTSFERQQNRWAPGTWLVASPSFVTDAAAGHSSLVLRLPTSDTSTRAVDLTLTEHTSYVQKVSRVVGPSGLTAKVTQPDIYRYDIRGFDPNAPRPRDGAWFDLIATNEGELHATGIFAQRRFELHGRNPGWTLDVTVPGSVDIDPSTVVLVLYEPLGDYGEAQASACSTFGGAACGWFCANTGVPCGKNPHTNPSNHCIDGIDNDGDGTTDVADEECRHHDEYSCDAVPGSHLHYWESGESLGIFADARYCTNNRSTWFAQVTRQGWDAELLLRGAEDPSFLWGDEQSLRYLAAGCWVFPSVEAAEACTVTGECPAWASEYPYANAGRLGRSFYYRAWDDVQHAAAHGLKHALHQASVIYYGSNGAMNCADDPNDDEPCCGLAPSGGQCGFAGASVVATAQYGCFGPLYTTIAHEIGHTLGLGHDNTAGPSVEYEFLDFSFMNKISGTSRSLCSNNAAQKQLGLATHACARPPGFRHAGGGSCGECGWVDFDNACG